MFTRYGNVSHDLSIPVFAACRPLHTEWAEAGMGTETLRDGTEFVRRFLSDTQCGRASVEIARRRI
jgi:hypothetical protein